jgi:hypothetical protein
MGIDAEEEAHVEDLCCSNPILLDASSKAHDSSNAMRQYALTSFRIIPTQQPIRNQKLA